MDTSTSIDPHSARFAAIIPVGPSPAEHARLFDLLDSLWWYEPHVWRIVLVDDSTGDRPLPRPPSGAASIERIFNPRAGRGHPVTGGLCAGMLAGIRHCVTTFPSRIDFAVKLDTDALVIAPFSEKLTRLFRERPTIGMAGAYRKTPNGDERDFTEWHQLINDLASRWVFNRSRRRRAGRTIPSAFWGKCATMRRQVRGALHAGYIPGENILGGAYAISGEVVRATYQAGALDDPLLWLDTTLGEDVLLSMLTRLVGKELADYCADSEVFGVRYRGLPDSPRRLVERGFSIIHSTKNDPIQTEAAIRDHFLSLRKVSARRPRAC